MTTEASEDSVFFARELKRLPVLSREEETELAQDYAKTQNPKARRRLVEGHLRLVMKLAYECRSRQIPMTDLIQEGCVGLLKAVERYDPNRGVRLSSYAAWWIRAHMYQYIMTNVRLVRVATTFAQRKLFFALRRERAKLACLGTADAAPEIAANLDVSAADVIEMEKRLDAQDVSLDQDVSIDSAALDSADRPDRELEEHDLHRVVRDVVDEVLPTLEGREQVIFQNRLMTENPLTLQELGEKFGISRERARQLEERIKDRLRARLTAALSTDPIASSAAA